MYSLDSCSWICKSTLGYVKKKFLYPCLARQADTCMLLIFSLCCLHVVCCPCSIWPFSKLSMLAFLSPVFFKLLQPPIAGPTEKRTKEGYIHNNGFQSTSLSFKKGTKARHANFVLFCSNMSVFLSSMMFYNHNTRIWGSFSFAQAHVVQETCLLKLCILLCSIMHEKTTTREGKYKKPAAKTAARYPGKLNSHPRDVMQWCTSCEMSSEVAALAGCASFPRGWVEILDLGARFECMTCKNTNHPSPSL